MVHRVKNVLDFLCWHPMATNKMAAISNKKWLICNQDYKLLITAIIIIPSAVWSEHMPTMTEHFFIYTLYILKVYIFENQKILQKFRIYFWCHFQTIKKKR